MIEGLEWKPGKQKGVHVDRRAVETEKRGWIDGFQMHFEEKFIGLACGLDTRWGAGDYQRD